MNSLAYPNRYIEKQRSGEAGGAGDGGEGATAEAIDLTGDCELAADIRPDSSAEDTSTRPPANVFLTGSTGFVGSFLLAELLRATPVTTRVHCLVRAKSEAAARAKLRKAVTGLGLWSTVGPQFDARVVLVVGDLGESRLGLDAAAWDALASVTDRVIHCGAYVHAL